MQTAARMMARGVVSGRRLVRLSAVSTRRQLSFAAVDHSEAYQTAMQGAHGKQLALAALEGIGKDDAPFDPFLLEELAEQQAALEKEEEEEEEDTTKSDNLDDEFNDDDSDEFSSIYNNDGSLKRTRSELATLRAGAPAGGLLAIVELAGTQHKVTTDDVLIVNRLKPINNWSVGSVHTLSSVMLMSSSHWTLVGMPYIAQAQVNVMVEEVTRDKKVIIFKKRRRKNSQRKNGFRRDVTMLRILDIRPPEKYQDYSYVERPEPQQKESM